MVAVVPMRIAEDIMIMSTITIITIMITARIIIVTMTTLERFRSDHRKATRSSSSGHPAEYPVT